MVKYKVNISIDREVWKTFRQYCIGIDSNVSREVEKFIKNKLKWKK